jgi:hypothetical protein
MLFTVDGATQEFKPAVNVTMQSLPDREMLTPEFDPTICSHGEFPTMVESP